MKGQGLSAVFLARNRFAVLDKTRQILVKDFENQVGGGLGCSVAFDE